ncbi:MAG: DNA-protecting protein DprA [Rhodobacteraceae bacterium]|nr:DNA-protecting protein DprA [Paracoccaceae bacterium]
MSDYVSLSAIPLLALTKLNKIGSATALNIIDRPVTEKSSKGCREYLISRLAAVKNLPCVTSIDIDHAWSASEDEIESSIQMGMKVITFHDDAYPARLKNIPNPPALLFIKGSEQAMHANLSLAVVGTREPTSFGMEVARRTGKTAAEGGYVIVSGLASGCDTYAHLGCLEATGTGLAVLAHGLDRVYPESNRGLADQLLDHGGCLASEYPVGKEPARYTFAARDRLQSGLSDGVLVIETDVRGGTMNTVHFASKQKRRIACIEHPKQYQDDKKTRGNRKLINERNAFSIPNGKALIEFLDCIKPTNTTASEVRCSVRREHR